MRAGTCGKCGIEMKVLRETESVWVFTCGRCGLTSAVSKRLIGGTRGSGAKDDGSTGIAHRGYRGIVR